MSRSNPTGNAKPQPRTKRPASVPLALGEDAEAASWRDRIVGRSLQRAMERSLERGQTFIDAALTLLRESDGDGFTVQEVADTAGQSVRTFYQHFAGKDDLLLAVYEEESKGQEVRLRRLVDKHDDPLERLAAYVVGSAATRGPATEIAALFRFRNRLAETQPRQLAVALRPVVRLAVELVRDAVEAGAIPPCDPETSAHMIVTLWSGYLHSRFLGNELGVELPSPTELARFCLGGLNSPLPASFARP